MTQVQHTGSASTKSPRVTDLLKIGVQENDPQLKAAATAFGFKVSGTATNNGTIASALRLTFDRKEVSIQVSRGDTGATIFRKLKAALPKGYEARVLATQGKDVTIGIAKKKGAGGGAGSIDPAKIPMSIAANQASANVESSMWINRMPGPGRGGPKNAIASVNVTGTGFADAPPKFQVKSIDVYEKGTNKKVATIANPKLQDSQTQWGQKTQSYRLELPEAKLDLKKTYTFVVNTGINGSKPQPVRSEYVKVGQAF